MIKFDDSTRKPLCLACEEMLTDALDQALSSADQAWFDRHTSTCVDCSDMLADAQRGAAWLEMLRTPRPEPSAQLLERILAQTTGAQATSESLTPIILGQPSILPAATPTRSNLLSFRPRLPQFAAWTSARFEPRLAMTAAMAFFSIALTLNLSGVRLDQLNASNLNPANLKHTYYEANAQAVRYYDNLHVVHVMESRVEAVRDADSNRETQPTSAPESNPTPDRQNDQPKQKEEKSKDGPISQHQPTPNPRQDPRQVAAPHFHLTQQPIPRSGNPPASPSKSTKEGGLA